MEAENIGSRACKISYTWLYDFKQPEKARIGGQGGQTMAETGLSHKVTSRHSQGPGGP